MTPNNHVSELRMVHREKWILVVRSQPKSETEVGTGELDTTLVFKRAAGLLLPLRPPQVLIDKAGWGKWSRLVGRTLLEKYVFPNGLKSVFSPTVSTTANGDATELLIRPNGLVLMQDGRAGSGDDFILGSRAHYDDSFEIDFDDADPVQSVVPASDSVDSGMVVQSAEARE